MLVRVLLAFETRAFETRFSRLLHQPTVLLSTTRSRRELWPRLAAETFDIVVAGRKTLGDPAHETVASIRCLPDPPDVVVVTSIDDPEQRAKILAAGGLAVLFAGLSDDVIQETLSTLVRRHRGEALQRLKSHAETGHHLGDFVSASSAMQELLAVARRVTQSDTSLLIVGETGVGKEWLARAIHEDGSRANGPFIAVNCGAIAEGLLESELFGHDEGAFTGAKRAHRGYFELAHQGTIFLDEIAEMPTHLQVKLLRVLQEKKIRRVGSESRIDVDVRIVAATNRNLDEEIRARRFRADLYYRIGVVTLAIPPLRERREDIPELVQTYLELFQIRLGRPSRTIRPEAMRALAGYSWPGNVRELINVMERAVLLSNSQEIGLADLPETITARERGAEASAFGGFQSNWLQKPLEAARGELVSSFERTYLTTLLEECKGRVGETAERAGITPRSLFEKMRRYGLRKEDFRG